MSLFGNRVEFTRNVQCEWDIPLSSYTYTVPTRIEPRARYIYPREPNTNLNASFIAPEYSDDWKRLMTGNFGTSWYDVLSSNLYDINLRMGWRCRYQLQNQTNHPIRYTAYLVKVRRDVPHVDLTTTVNSADYSNIFNVAGNYIARTGDFPTIPDANNPVLTYESQNVWSYPPVKDVWKVVKRVNFSLDPGQFRAFSLSRKIRRINLVRMYPPTKLQTTVQNEPPPAMEWDRGDCMYVFRQFSAPADYDQQPSSDPLVQFSTRTTGVSLLTYEVKYYCRLFNNSMLGTKTRIILPTLGMVEAPTALNVRIMGDNDVKAEAESSII